MNYTRWTSVQQRSEILTVLATGAPNTFTEIMSRDGRLYWLSWIPTGVNMADNNAKTAWELQQLTLQTAETPGDRTKVPARNHCSLDLKNQTLISLL